MLSNNIQNNNKQFLDCDKCGGCDNVGYINSSFKVCQHCDVDGDNYDGWNEFCDSDIQIIRRNVYYELDELITQYKDDFYNNRCSHNFIKHAFIIIGETKFYNRIEKQKMLKNKLKNNVKQLPEELQLLIYKEVEPTMKFKNVITQLNNMIKITRYNTGFYKWYCEEIEYEEGEYYYPNTGDNNRPRMKPNISFVHLLRGRNDDLLFIRDAMNNGRLLKLKDLWNYSMPYDYRSSHWNNKLFQRQRIRGLDIIYKYNDEYGEMTDTKNEYFNPRDFCNRYHTDDDDNHIYQGRQPIVVEDDVEFDDEGNPYGVNRMILKVLNKSDIFKEYN